MDSKKKTGPVSWIRPAFPTIFKSSKFSAGNRINKTGIKNFDVIYVFLRMYASHSHFPEQFLYNWSMVFNW